MRRFPDKTASYLIAVTLITLAAAMRLLPHPANFAPVAAVAIFGGAVLPRRVAVWVPLLTMALSDTIIGFYGIMPVVWGCYVLVAFTSSYALVRPNFVKGASLTVGASLFFFAVTNLAVWLWSGMYAHSWQGLAQCYTMALPFFRNTLFSDLVFTGMLFGLFYSARYLARKTFVGVSHRGMA